MRETSTRFIWIPIIRGVSEVGRRIVLSRPFTTTRPLRSHSPTHMSQRREFGHTLDWRLPKQDNVQHRVNVSHQRSPGSTVAPKIFMPGHRRIRDIGKGDKWGRFYSRNTRMLEQKKGVFANTEQHYVKPLPKRQHSGQLSERPQRYRHDPSEKRRRRLHPNHTPGQIQQAKKLPTEADLDRKLANIKARRDGGT